MNDFPPNVIEFIQRQLSQFGRVGSTKTLRAPALPAALAAGTAVDSQPVTIRIREPGTIIACYGQELAGTTAKFAATEVRVRIGGQEDLFSDGQSGVFFPMLGLFGPNANWYPLWRRGIPGVDWTIQYRNNDTGATATPSFGLAFIADADLARNMPPGARR
jgi:hypothetical protein